MHVKSLLARWKNSTLNDVGNYNETFFLGLQILKHFNCIRYGLIIAMITSNTHW